MARWRILSRLWVFFFCLLLLIFFVPADTIVTSAPVLSDMRMQDKGIHENNVGDWIKNNCRRIDILLDTSLVIFILELIEAVLHYKYEPIYEGFAAQR